MLSFVFILLFAESAVGFLEGGVIDEKMGNGRKEWVVCVLGVLVAFGGGCGGVA